MVAQTCANSAHLTRSLSTYMFSCFVDYQFQNASQHFTGLLTISFLQPHWLQHEEEGERNHQPLQHASFTHSESVYCGAVEGSSLSSLIKTLSNLELWIYGLMIASCRNLQSHEGLTQQPGASVALMQQCVVLLGHNDTACFLSGA